jgi:hypothetical protein
MTGLDLKIIDTLTGGRLGTYDVPCLLCGPARRRTVSQRKPVLRIWRDDPGFASYYCVRCGEKGHVRDGSAVMPNSAAIARARAEGATRERVAVAERLSKARWLWANRQQIHGSVAETYLRDARGYHGPIPPTLAFLPARGEHGPSMIAAFGIPEEPEPGQIAIAANAVRGVHLTCLAADGSGKAGTDKDKIIVGKCPGLPIVLAPPNDLLGLAITEGIENALSAHASTGLGAWAAGAASRLPALAEVIPDYIDAVIIFADDDQTGLRHANELLERLKIRGISADLFLPNRASRSRV